MKKDLNVRSETSCVTNPIQLPLTSASGSAENHGCTCAERPFLFCPGTESSPHVNLGGEPPIPTLSIRMASHLKHSGTRTESYAFRIGRTGQRVDPERDTTAFHHPRIHRSPHASVDAAALRAASDPAPFPGAPSARRSRPENDRGLKTGQETLARSNVRAYVDGGSRPEDERGPVLF